MHVQMTDVIGAVKQATSIRLSGAQQDAVARSIWSAIGPGKMKPAQAFKSAWPPAAGAMPEGLDSRFSELLRDAARRHEAPAETPAAAATAARTSTAAGSDPEKEANDKVKKVSSLAQGTKKSIDAARKKGLEIRDLAKKSGVKAAISLANDSKDLAEAVKAAVAAIHQAQTDANRAVRAKNWNAVEHALQAAEAAADTIDKKLDALDELEIEVKETIEEGDITFWGRQRARLNSQEGWYQLGTLAVAGLIAWWLLGGLGIFLVVILVLANTALNPKTGMWTNIAFIAIIVAMAAYAALGGGDSDGRREITATIEPTVPAVVNQPDDPMPTPPHP